MDAFGNVFASNPVASNETIGDVTYQVRHLDTVTGCFSTAVPYVVNVKERPAAPNLVQDWLACLGDLNPAGIQEGVHFELPVGGNHSVRIYDGDSLTILTQFPQPSTNLVDTSIYYLSSLLAYPNLQCESAESVALRAITLPLPVTAVAISDSDQVVCMDQILTLSVNDTVGSGNTYVWSVDDNQDGVFDAMGNGLQRTYTVANAGPYQFRVTTTDLFGCEAEDLKYMTHALVLAPNALTTPAAEYCQNDTVSLDIAANGSGYAIEWLDAFGNAFASNPVADNSTIGSSIYQIRHADTATGCVSTPINYVVQVRQRPASPYLIADWMACLGDATPPGFTQGVHYELPTYPSLGNTSVRFADTDSLTILPSFITIDQYLLHIITSKRCWIIHCNESAEAFCAPLPCLSPLQPWQFQTDQVVCMDQILTLECQRYCW